MIPGEVVVITNYMTIQKLDLINTYAGLVLPSLTSGTSIFLMRQYFLTLPKDFRDAARLDGCGDLGFLFHIVFPLSIPTISSLAKLTTTSSTGGLLLALQRAIITARP